MQVIDDLYYYTYWVLFWGLFVLRLWALVDCATRKMAAFPAVNKLTKPAWLAMLAVGLLFSWISPAPVGPISLITTVLAAVYLADVRPAVREISGGAGR